jgi:hypothetical protein
MSGDCRAIIAQCFNLRSFVIEPNQYAPSPLWVAERCQCRNLLPQYFTPLFTENCWEAGAGLDNITIYAYHKIKLFHGRGDLCPKELLKNNLYNLLEGLIL